MSSVVKLDQITNRPKVCIAIGNFDGVHRGHQVLLDRICERAKNLDSKAWVLTFEPHPQILLKGCEFKLLQTYEQKYSAILNHQLDAVLVANFNSTFRNQSPEAFLQNLYQLLDIQAIQVGYDFRFGKGGIGDSTFMSQFFKNYNIEVDITHRQEIDGVTYSSGNLRKAILRGDIEYYHKTVGRHFQIGGKVVKGSQRGRTIGFPTANIVPPKEQISLLPGVYAVKCTYQNRILTGLANLGNAPTFQQENYQLEVYFQSFNDDLYDKILNIEFLDRIRDVKKFDGIDQLKQQISTDLSWFDKHNLTDFRPTDCSFES